jgi:CRP-like cAMP-binding protein
MLKRQLIDSLGSLHPVSEAYESFLDQEHPFHYRPIRRGSLILLPGMNADQLHFVSKGMFILYRYNGKGDEVVLDFFWEHMFIMLPVDFYDGTENKLHYIRAIENSEILSISKADMDIIYRLFPEARIHSDRIRSETELRASDHLRLLLQSKDDRYAEFVKIYKGTAARLTEYLISSFLGICIKTLNRAKRKRKPRIRTFVCLFAGHLSCFFA